MLLALCPATAAQASFSRNVVVSDWFTGSIRAWQFRKLVCSGPCNVSAVSSTSVTNPCFVTFVQAGALVAGVVFALTGDQGKFYISAACGAAGVACTFLLIPDITGLDLREGDRRWLKSLEGPGEHCCLHAFHVKQSVSTCAGQ